MARRSGQSPLGAGFSRARYTTVYVRVPLPVTLRVRRVSYPYPLQRERARRSIRVPLMVLPTRYRMARVAVRVPRHLPVVKGSYVSVREGRLTVHSKRQRARLMVSEFNRPRESERKGRRRQARNGQLESVRRDRHGILAESARRGMSASQLGDAALVVRALGG